MSANLLDDSVGRFSRALQALDGTHPQLRRLRSSLSIDPESARRLASVTAQRAQVLIQAAQLLAQDAEIEIAREKAAR